MEDNTEESLLQLEGVNVYNAETLEKDVIDKINKNIQEKERAELNKKCNGIINQIRSVASSLRQNESAIKFFGSKPQSEIVVQKLTGLKTQNGKYKSQISLLESKLENLKSRLAKVSKVSSDLGQPPPLAYDKSKISSAKSLKERRQLIKKGLATPFSLQKETVVNTAKKIKPPIKLDDAFGNFLSSGLIEKNKPTEKPIEENGNVPEKLNAESISSNFASTSRKRHSFPVEDPVQNKQRRKSLESDEDYKMPSDDADLEDSDEYEIDLNEKIKLEVSGPNKKRTANRQRKVSDDANPKAYKRRMIRHKQLILREQAEGTVSPSDKHLDGGLKVPGKTWKKLYKYQQTGVKWLWELHSQQAGGILGDEMGLGKTIQIIAFLDALRQSKVRDRDSSYSYNGLGPVLIVSPTTVMHQWVREIHLWAPLLRVAVLHNSGSYKGAKADLIHNIVLSHGVLVTSYERMRISIDALIDKNWHYVILDEGHKIRNPEAAVTHAIKMFQTPHRLILSGSPIQNNLKELWSLFDFIFPGKLGTLQCFMEQFSVPIVQGGYANASEVQVQTAYKCACVLRDTIAPYLLRRMKVDVQNHINLPKKNDHVLFCSLTDDQVEVYKKYLDSETVYSILCRNMKIFVGLIQLRKMCNHPDLYTGGPKLLVGEQEPPLDSDKRYGFWKRSGKMIVVDSLLKIWKKQNKKVLLFTQSKLMLNVLEDFVKLRNYTYMTMHGGTPVSSRQPLVKSFNEDPSIFVFILTTRVGGLGVNLVGANRVVIFDPDWNPSTDLQAQERSWRIGQNQEVTIYRLITTGTIEEKIYHRQIFKQFMSNRVLKDPKQRRFFKTNDMHELFTLQHQSKDGVKTETASIFAGTGSEIKPWKLKAKLRAQKALERQQRGDHDADTATHAANRSVDRYLDQSIPSTSTEPFEEAHFSNEQPTSSTRLSNDVIGIDSNDVTSTSTDYQDDANVEKLGSEPISDLSSTAPPDDANGSPQDSENGQCGVTMDSRGGGSEKIKESFLKVLRKFKESKQKSVKSETRRAKKNGKIFDVDGEMVDYVTKKSTFKPPGEEFSRKNSDEYVLHKLFKKGVHTAMRHSTIMNSSTADYALVESEANRVAKEAIKNLKLSRKQYRYPSSKPAQRPRFGRSSGVQSKQVDKKDESSEDETPMATGNVFGKRDGNGSSANILKQIKMRTHEEEEEQKGSDESDSEVEEDFHLLPSDDEDYSDDDKLLREIVQFLSEECKGEASTDRIMSKFKSRVEVKQAPKFKAMLLRICEKSKRNEVTRWRLKPEFY